MSQIKGKLVVKGDTTKVSDKFTKRTFVLLTEEDSKFPQYIELQLVQDKCSLIDNISIGDIIDAEYSLRGRSWLSPKGETKYFNTIEAWKITADSPAFTSITKGKAINPQASDVVKAEELNDLPL
jgi:hypothetical protein